MPEVVVHEPRRPLGAAVERIARRHAEPRHLVDHRDLGMIEGRRRQHDAIGGNFRQDRRRHRQRQQRRADERDSRDARERVLLAGGRAFHPERGDRRDHRNGENYDHAHPRQPDHIKQRQRGRAMRRPAERGRQHQRQRAPRHARGERQPDAGVNENRQPGAEEDVEGGGHAGNCAGGAIALKVYSVQVRRLKTVLIRARRASFLARREGLSMADGATEDRGR